MTQPHQPALDKWVTDLNRYFADLETAQTALERNIQQMLRAFAVLHPQAMTELAKLQQSITQQLQQLHDRRQHLLETARSQGYPENTLQQLSVRISNEIANDSARQTAALQFDAVRIDALKAQGERLRRANWQQWIIARRADQHHQEMRQLIASSGKKPLSMKRSHAELRGGGILDASA